MNIREIADRYTEDVIAVQDWCDELYEEYFSSYFVGEKSLFNKIKSNANSVTDSELEWILTSLPLELFEVAEKLSQFKLNQEVVKLKIREKELDEYHRLSDDIKSETKRKEVASQSVLGDKIVISVYNTIISRVENEISFTKELIMGAKKVWDARKANINPVGEVVPDDANSGDDLPEYRHEYIR